MPQTLVQDPQALPCEEVRLGGLAILSRHARARGERIGGGPIHYALLTDPERLTGPSAPRSDSPHLVPQLTPRISERAEWRRRTRRP